MQTYSNNLQHFVSFSIAPSKLIEKNLNSADFKIWRASIRNFSDDLKFRLGSKLLGDESRESKTAWMINLQEVLISQNDKINQYLFNEERLWSRSTFCKEIKEMYLFSQNQLDGLLFFMKSNFPAYFDNHIKHSSSQLRSVIPEAKTKLNTITQFLNMHQVDAELIRLISDDFKQLFRSRRYAMAHHEYLMTMVQELLKIQKLSTPVLINELIRLDFNTPGYLSYLMTHFHTSLQKTATLHKQLEFIVIEKDKLTRAKELARWQFTIERSSIRLDYLDYLNQKYEHTAALMEIKRLELKDRFDPDHMFRIPLNASVSQFGLFIRILIEKEIVQQSKVADLFKFFSSNFYTKNANFISAKSLQDKSTSVRLPDALKLYRFFKISMDWLDVHYQVKDHNRAMR